MSRDAPTFVVIGATGYTGGLIARALSDRGTSFVVAGRDAARLKGLAAELQGATPQVADVTDRASLHRLIRPGDAVINTAGPFTELGDPVVAACVEIGAHYLDTTGEQPFMHHVHRKYHDAAEEAGVAVVNAMAFEYALGDCALAVGAEGLVTPLRSADVIYAWGGAASSRGTRRTVIGMLGQKGWTREDGEFGRTALGAGRRTVRLGSGRQLSAVAFPSGEVVGAAASRAIPLIAPTLPLVVPVLRPVLTRIATRAADPTPEERRASRFTIRVELVDGNGAERTLEVQGRDPYGVTAVTAIAGARRAMEPDAPAGVLAPAQLVHPGPFLASLGDHDVVLVDERTR
jgi:short subunit dehydrogenase-like uncharacterized protein